jgi:hypothetical protein
MIRVVYHTRGFNSLEPLAHLLLTYIILLHILSAIDACLFIVCLQKYPSDQTYQPKRKSDSANLPSSAANDNFSNATAHILLQYSPDTFIFFPTSLNGSNA